MSVVLKKKDISFKYAKKNIGENLESLVMMT